MEHPFCKDIDWEKLSEKMYRPPIKVNVGISNVDSEFSSMKIKLKLDKEETPFSLAEELKTEIVSSVKRIRSHSNVVA